MENLIFTTAFLLTFCLTGQEPKGDLAIAGNNTVKATSTDEEGIQTQVGKYFILREENQYCAAKIIRENSDGDAEYEWYFQGDRSGNFLRENSKHGQGKVFERYKREETGDNYFLTDIGSVLDIKCGPLTVKWSQGNWIYFHHFLGKNTKIEIALTEWSSINEVNVFDQTLKWLKYKPKEK